MTPKRTLKKLTAGLMALTLSASLAPAQAAATTYWDVDHHQWYASAVEFCQQHSLMDGVNDTKEDAEQLILLAKPFGCHVNLIPVNPVKERGFRQSEQKVVDKFKNKLEKYGINVTIRREMGRDIDGACGQLRKKHIDKERGIN